MLTGGGGRGGSGKGGWGGPAVVEPLVVLTLRHMGLISIPGSGRKGWGGGGRRGVAWRGVARLQHLPCCVTSGPACSGPAVLPHARVELEGALHALRITGPLSPDQLSV